MARRVEAAAVEKFLQEHRFSGIDHCRRAGRWPLSRRCCPLSLAAESGDVPLVTLLLKHGADPLLPQLLARPREAATARQQDARRLLERAAGKTGRGLAADAALGTILHIADAIGQEREEPLLRDLQRSDPLLRQPAAGAASSETPAGRRDGA